MKKITLLTLGLSFTIISLGQLIQKSNEIIEKRSINSKHFQLENGSISATISNQPIHYRDKESNWKDINTEIITSNFSTYTHENSANTLKSYFSANGVKIESNDGEILIGKNTKLVWIDENLKEVVVEDHINKTGIATNNTFKYEGSFQNGDVEYIVKNGLVKNNVILHKLPDTFKNKNGYLGYSENIELPEGWVISVNNEVITSSTTTTRGLYIQNKHRENAFHIPSPEAYEDIKSTNGLNENCHYLITKNNKGYNLITMVPISWLSNTNTNYPVTIDPTITTYGINGGWQDLTTFVEADGFIFTGLLSVTDHRSYIKFDISSINCNVVIIDTVEVQLYQNGEENTTATTIEINDVTGTKGPYSSIDTSAHIDFGNGLYTSFSATGSGYYGYYDLGTNAVTNLSADLPSGEFQIALEEPSVSTWKRFTGSLSSLRVVYSATSTTIPVITCINDTIINVNSGNCNAIFNYTSPPVGSCETLTQIAGLTSGSSFSLGTTTNSFVLSNGGLVNDTCSFDVTVISTSNSSQNVTVCDTAVINGNEYTSSQIIIDTLMGMASTGCDSIVTTNLVINPSYDIEIDTTISIGSSLLFNGNTETATGTYIGNFTSSDNCDSTVTLNLTVGPNGINNLLIDVNVFPNPMKSTLSIESDIELNSIKLINIEGKVIVFEKITNANTVIDISNLSSGMYYYEIVSVTNKVARGKVIKE